MITQNTLEKNYELHYMILKNVLTVYAWLEDCINCLLRCGVKDDILYLVFQLNKKAMIIVRTPFGNTEPVVEKGLLTICLFCRALLITQSEFQEEI